MDGEETLPTPFSVYGPYVVDREEVASAKLQSARELSDNDCSQPITQQVRRHLIKN